MMTISRMDQESKEEKKNGWALRKETLLSKTLRHTTPVSYTMHDTALQGYTKTPCASRHKTLDEKKDFQMMLSWIYIYRVAANKTIDGE